MDAQTATLIATVGGFAVALAAFLTGMQVRLEHRLTARMDRLEDRLNVIDARLGRVETEVAELRDRVDELSGLTRPLLTQRAA